MRAPRPRLRPTLFPSTLLVILTALPALAADVAGSAEEIRPILIGSRLPDAPVQTVEGSRVGLLESLGGRPTVLVVYRGGWCPFCNTQLSELRHLVSPLEELGVSLLGVSADAPERLQIAAAEQHPGFTLLADIELNAAKALGLAFQVSDEYVKKLGDYGLDISRNAVSTDRVLPVPAVFVVDAEGTVTFSYVNPDYRVRCDPDVVLAAARAVVASGS